MPRRPAPEFSDVLRVVRAERALGWALPAAWCGAAAATVPPLPSFGGRGVKTGQPYWEGSASTGICVSVGGAPESCGRVDVSMIGFGRGMV